MHFDAASPTTGNLLQSYGPGGFKVNNTLHESSILLSTDFIASFSGEFTLEALAPLLDVKPRIEVLILGTGKHLVPVPAPLKAALRARGIASDGMDTGAACRTYAVMHSEGRRVGAALLLQP